MVSAAKGYHCLPGSPVSLHGDAIRDHLFAIYNQASSEDCATRLGIQRRLQDIWQLLVRHIFPQSISSGHRHEDSRILDMLEYLREHYAEKFSLDAMAEHHHISRGECCRYFKKMMGMTITEFLLDYRLSKAAHWLSLTQMSITSIAHAAGFHSASYFSEEFKKKTGQTPSEYRTCTGK